MSKRMLRIAVLATLASVTCAHAQTAAEKRVRAFAALPDWTGIWEAEAWTQRTAAGRPAGGYKDVQAKAVLMGHPPYKPEWEARYQAGMKDMAALTVAERTRKSCSFSFPMIMESPSLFQVAITPEETLFVFVTQDVRHIYTDGRGHTPKDEIWPTRQGDSVGRWEGDTLVIETIARLSNIPISIRAPMSKVSDQARFTERVRLVNPNLLENQMTIEDPATLTKPWTVKIRYHRVKDLPRLGNYDCEQNDRNPIEDGKLTVSPP
jgi:hypothetical protein